MVDKAGASVSKATLAAVTNTPDDAPGREISREEGQAILTGKRNATWASPGRSSFVAGAPENMLLP